MSPQCPHLEEFERCDDTVVDCRTYTWRWTSWSTCLLPDSVPGATAEHLAGVATPCGAGRRFRYAECVRSDGQVVAERSCRQHLPVCITILHKPSTVSFVLIVMYYVVLCYIWSCKIRKSHIIYYSICRVGAAMLIRSVMHGWNLRGYKGYWHPHSLDWGTVPPLFRTPVTNLLSAAVNRGDLWRLNYTLNYKVKPFSAGLR